jgi:hypothetical protein
MLMLLLMLMLAPGDTPSMHTAQCDTMSSSCVPSLNASAALGGSSASHSSHYSKHALDQSLKADTVKCFSVEPSR